MSSGFPCKTENIFLSSCVVKSLLKEHLSDLTHSSPLKVFYTNLTAEVSWDYVKSDDLFMSQILGSVI